MMGDPYSQYEAGLNRLLTQLGQDHPRYTEALVLQQRLLENLGRVRRYGDTETNRAERAQIFDVLNRLALEAAGSSFNDLFLQRSSVAALEGSGAIAQGAGSLAAGAGGVAVGWDISGDVTVVPKEDRLSIRRLLAEARENLRLIQERQAQYVVSTDIPLQLVKEERRLLNRIAELEQQLAEPTVPGGPSPRRDVMGSTSEQLPTALVKRREQVLEAARKVGDRAAEGAALDKLGSVYAARGDFRRAVKHYEQAIDVARELGDQRAEAIYLQNLGLAFLRLAENEPDQRQAYLSRAADALQQAIRLFDMIKAAPLLRARTRYHLGRCYYQLGQWHEAIVLLEQAREVFSRHKARPELAHALLELGQLYYQTEDFESAYVYLKDALRLFRRLGDTDSIAVTQEALGSMELQAAHPSEAIVSLQEARQGYVALRRDERIRAVDDLLRMADRARQVAERMGVTP